MLEHSHFLIFVGFGIACVGFLAWNYVNFSVRGSLGSETYRRLAFTEYWRAVKQRWGSYWPLYTVSICIPVGIILMFAAIIYSNHLRLK
jgi:hypothetical protein